MRHRQAAAPGGRARQGHRADQFADDLSLPGMLHMKLLRATVPHARIARVDATRARGAPGVALVLTGADLPIPRHPAGVAGRARAVHRPRALRRRSGGGGNRGRRADRVRGDLEAADLGPRFDVVVDGKRRREGPSWQAVTGHVRRAADQLGVPVERAVVFEDAISGVEAGQAGGFGLVIGVDRGVGAQRLTESGADVVVDDLAELASS